MTLKQVAAHAGVHLSTVSRALDPDRRHLIGSEIIALIETAARELGFRPNHAAASLRRGRSMAIGVLVPDMTNPVIGQIMQGVEAAIVGSGYFPLMVSMQAAASSKAVIERLLSQRIDGMVVATAPSDDVIVRTLVDAGVPTVLTARADPSGRLSAVVSDRALAMSLAIDHLVELGHREIALLAGSDTTALGRERVEMSIAALRRHGLEPSAVAYGGNISRDAGQEGCRQLLAPRMAGAKRSRTKVPVRPRFTAICASSDLLAFGAYQVLREQGLLIPSHVSVVGQNDFMLADMVEPPLTTVRVQHYAMGHLAGRMLIEEIESRADTQRPGACPQRVVSFRPELVVRASTCAPS